MSINLTGGLTRGFAPNPQVLGSEKWSGSTGPLEESSQKPFFPFFGFPLPSHLENILPLPWPSAGTCDSPLRRSAVCQNFEWTSATLGGLVNQRSGLVPRVSDSEGLGMQPKNFLISFSGMLLLA